MPSGEVNVFSKFFHVKHRTAPLIVPPAPFTLGHQAASHTGFLCFFHSIKKYLSRICNVPDSLLDDGTVRVSRISWVLAVS